MAERGTATPVRQRTVTEVVWPEQMSSLNSGLRSRLNSNTSLFRAGSQKSVIGDSHYPLDRHESQRSVSEIITKPLLISMAAASFAEAGVSSSMGSAPAGGWRSEQGSPRRPASLVLTDTVNPHDWNMEKHRTMESPLPEKKLKLQTFEGTQVVSSSSPVVLHKRFATTNVELPPEQVLIT